MGQEIYIDGSLHDNKVLLKDSTCLKDEQFNLQKIFSTPSLHLNKFAHEQKEILTKIPSIYLFIDFRTLPGAKNNGKVVKLRSKL